MGRRVEQPAVSDDERETDLNRRWRQIEWRLRLCGVPGDPPNGPTFSEPMKRDLRRAMALPLGPARRAAVEAAGRRHLGDDAFERDFAFLLRDQDGPWR